MKECLTPLNLATHMKICKKSSLSSFIFEFLFIFEHLVKMKIFVIDVKEEMNKVGKGPPTSSFMQSLDYWFYDLPSHAVNPSIHKNIQRYAILANFLFF